MGKLVTLHGIDCIGKETQSKLLKDKLIADGYKVELVHFPRYGMTKAAELVTKYLRGDFGIKENLSPYFISMLYALDRKESSSYLLSLLDTNDFVVCDRYILDNFAYSLALFDDFNSYEALNFREWLYNLEYLQFYLPYPYLQIFLNVPPTASTHLLNNRSNNGDVLDIHELDLWYQEVVYMTYLKLGDTKNVEFIQCFGEKIYDKEKIAQSIYNLVNYKLSKGSNNEQKPVN